MRYDAAMKKTPSECAAERAYAQLLGGLTREAFLQQYWQKKPLLVRGAIPGFGGLLSAEELAGLACEDDVQSRLVIQQKGQWLLEHGPLEEARFAKLPERDWTLLVQEVNHHLSEAEALLQRFDFIPHARLDDLMVSYAPDGGGVGPHFDSYDVFLLQGQGKRLWRVSQQEDLSLVEGAPLRILSNFQTEQEYLLEAGDMLYLPPHVAHWGIAVGDCMTYSIGFRAPSAQELASQFLGYLQDRVDMPGMYADPDLGLQPHPAEIGDSMVARVSEMLDAIRWQAADVTDFLGQYLSEPKAHVLFDPPRAMSLSTFQKRLQASGIRLDSKSQLLFHGQRFFMNGESADVTELELTALMALADHRSLPPGAFTDKVLIERLHRWYLAGFLRFEWT
jgi:50S ribosomal protein L16 3-hydroxylase